MPKLNGAEAIVEGLLAHGVQTVFGIPGIQLDPLFDALHAHQDQIRTVHTRHEQGAAFMAMGYAQASGRTGVFAAVPGPGLLNAMAAVSTAVAGGLPVLGLTGQIPSYQIGEGFGIAHELRDQLATSRGVVEWAERADHPHQVPDLMEQAFSAMLNGRPGPAILEMAPDRLAAFEEVAVRESPSENQAPDPEEALIKQAAARLKAARCPAILVGGGTLSATGPLRQLAEQLQAPVISTISARGVLSDDHPLSYTVLAGQHIWEHVDVALVVGTRFTAPALSWGRLGEMDVFCAEADRVVRKKLDTLGPLPELARILRSTLPADGVVVADVTQLGSFVRYAMPAYGPRTIMGPGYQATLGYALPAALGVKTVEPERPVVAVCGDGGFMFTVQELATAVHHRIPVVTVVLDNASYGNVKTIQANSYGGRHIAVDLTNPDFVALGRSFGIESSRVDSPEAIGEALVRALEADAPRLIVVPIGEVPSIWEMIKRPPSQGVS